MKVTFTHAGGVSGTWDGCLWDCPGDRKMERWLNKQVLPERGPHDSLVDCARRLLGSYTEQPQGFEVVDLTGMPRERLGEDVFSGEEEVDAAGESGHIGLHDGATETGTASSALTAAEAFFGGGLCPDATDVEDEDDWDGPEQQWADFTGWCGRENLILNGPGPEHDGGREHDVRFNDAGWPVVEIHQTKFVRIYRELDRWRGAVSEKRADFRIPCTAAPAKRAAGGRYSDGGVVVGRRAKGRRAHRDLSA